MIARLDPRLEFVRYVLNGLVATGVHFLALTAGLDWLHLPSAGLANLFAAAFGITTSFLGSRYFVFPARGGSLAIQAPRFLALYGAIALAHGALLFVWTDTFALDYRAGFVLAVALQVIGSYFGNKYLVFTR